MPASDSNSRTSSDVVVPPALEAPRTKLSYLYLHATGGARMTELREALDVPLLSLYPTVAGLIDEGVVERTDDGVLRPCQPTGGW